MNLPHHHESTGWIPAPLAQVFAHVDDPTRLSAHMRTSSWRMGGGRMQTITDAAQGKAIGSRMQLSGRVFGLVLSVAEIVTQRNSPYRKVWETVGTPRLLVIGHYRMGVELSAQGNGALLRVFIDYALPESAPGSWLGRLSGKYYARWCTQQMVDDAVKSFAVAAN